MGRIGLSIGALILLSMSAWATPKKRMETGLIVARAQSGFWARFPQPVQAGGIAWIRAFQDGEEIGTAHVIWASTVPPYEALLTDIRPLPPVHPVSSLSAYQSLFGERDIAELRPDEIIVPGQYVLAAPAPETAAGDPLRITWQELVGRPEVQDYLRRLRPGRARERVSPPEIEATLRRITENRHYLWRDPITARLVARAADMLQERGRVTGKVPGNWFPLTPTPPEGETTP